MIATTIPEQTAPNSDDFTPVKSKRRCPRKGLGGEQSSTTYPRKGLGGEQSSTTYPRKGLGGEQSSTTGAVVALSRSSYPLRGPCKGLGGEQSSTTCPAPKAHLIKETKPHGAHPGSEEPVKMALRSLLIKEGITTRSIDGRGPSITVLSHEHPTQCPPAYHHEYSRHEVKMHLLPCSCREISRQQSLVASICADDVELQCYAILVFEPKNWMKSYNNKTLYVALTSSTKRSRSSELPESIQWLLELLLHDSSYKQPELAEYLRQGFDPAQDRRVRSGLTGLQSVSFCYAELVKSVEHYNAGAFLVGPMDLLQEISDSVALLPGATEYRLDVLSWRDVCDLSRKGVVGITYDLVRYIRTKQATLGNLYFLVGRPNWKPDVYEFSFGKREWMPEMESPQSCAARELYEEYRIYLDQSIWSKVLSEESSKTFPAYCGRFYQIDLTGTKLQAHETSVFLTF